MAQETTRIDSKYAERERRWVHMDAKEFALGRLASRAASLLRGKHKRFYMPDVDCGDFVLVTNASQVRLTGKKLESRGYFSHSGHAGGAKVTPLKLLMERDPRKVVYLAVKRMLPTNHLRQRQLKRLKIYPGESHPYGVRKTEPSHG